MTMQLIVGKTPEEVVQQFVDDGYWVDPEQGVITIGDAVGIVAVSSAYIGPTEIPKRVFYLKGSPYEMGYLMGRLAPSDVSHMCTEFVPNIMFNYLNITDPKMQQRLKQTLLDSGYWVARAIKQDVPKEYLDELQGIIDGCADAEPSVAVSFELLWLLNVGFDAMMSVGYTGKLPLKKMGGVLPIDPARLRTPAMCNGFCTHGTAQGQPYYYMGRDFQFSTGDVFQLTATTLIRVPTAGLPSVTVTAPGMVGAIAGLNSRGVGVGVDMLPAANCDVWRPGLNSLLMMRHAVQYGGTLGEATKIVTDARRGVSWIYVIGDAQSDQAGILETGKTETGYTGLGEMPADMHAAALKSQPDFDGLIGVSASTFDRGVTARAMPYTYPNPDAFLDRVNRSLMDAYRVRDPSYTYQYNPADFGERGFLNKSGSDHNCPASFYFAPQRETRSDLVLVTNGAITPHMRLYGMAEWVTRMAGPSLDNIQLRYDRMNKALLDALDKGYVTYDEAKAIIDGSDHELNSGGVIGGAVSIMDLRATSIESHYGYEGDAWIKLRLKDYL